MLQHISGTSENTRCACTQGPLSPNSTQILSLLVIQELLKRYNPLHDMTADEHLTATVNRVGLQMPTDFDPEAKS